MSSLSISEKKETVKNGKFKACFEVLDLK